MRRTRPPLTVFTPRHPALVTTSVWAVAEAWSKFRWDRQMALLSTGMREEWAGKTMMVLPPHPQRFLRSQPTMLRKPGQSVCRGEESGLQSWWDTGKKKVSCENISGVKWCDIYRIFCCGGSARTVVCYICWEWRAVWFPSSRNKIHSFLFNILCTVFILLSKKTRMRKKTRVMIER